MACHGAIHFFNWTSEPRMKEKAPRARQKATRNNKPRQQPWSERCCLCLGTRPQKITALWEKMCPSQNVKLMQGIRVERRSFRMIPLMESMKATRQKVGIITSAAGRSKQGGNHKVGDRPFKANTKWGSAPSACSIGALNGRIPTL